MQNISLTAPQGNPVFSLAENPLKKDQELAIFWINLDQWIVHYSQSPMPINLPSKACMWETIISWQIHTQVDLMISTSAARITRTQDASISFNGLIVTTNSLTHYHRSPNIEMLSHRKPPLINVAFMDSTVSFPLIVKSLECLT